MTSLLRTAGAPLLVMVAPSLLGGCLMKAVDTDPKPPIALPEGYSADEQDPGRWWTTFEDDELNELMQHALRDNLQLRQAWARLKQAKALERGAAAGLFPRIDASLSAGRSQSPPRVFNFGGQEQTIPGVEADNFAASLPVSYELDLWGRVRAGMLAAEQDTIAARADVEAAAMTISASVTERWFDVLEQRALRRLIEDQIAVNRAQLEIVASRFAEGASETALSDVYQQRQQIQLLETQLAAVSGQETLAEQQLAVLIGKAPSSLVSADRTGLPALPPLPEAGIPASLLELRPDVRAAKARVVAADYRVAQAIAARLPNLTLSGSLGFNSISVAQFFESFIWSITASAAGTIWDGGRLDSEIERSEAVVEERLAAYGQTLLTALVEVETALTSERVTQDRIAILSEQVETARKTLEAARLRFAAGVGNYLVTLTALRSLQQAEQQLLSAQRQLLSQRVQVYRALGSRWTSELEAPEPPKEESNESPADEEAS